jgi:hypothetical protein
MNFDFSFFREAKKAAADELTGLDAQIAAANGQISKHSYQSPSKADIKSDFDAWLATCPAQIADLSKRNLNPRQNTLRKNGPLFVIQDARGDVNPFALLALMGAIAAPAMQKIVHSAIDAMVYENESALTAVQRAAEIKRAGDQLGTLHARRQKLLDDAATAGLSFD